MKWAPEGALNFRILILVKLQKRYSVSQVLSWGTFTLTTSEMTLSLLSKRAVRLIPLSGHGFLANIFSTTRRLRDAILRTASQFPSLPLDAICGARARFAAPTFSLAVSTSEYL